MRNACIRSCLMLSVVACFQAKAEEPIHRVIFHKGSIEITFEDEKSAMAIPTIGSTVTITDGKASIQGAVHSIRYAVEKIPDRPGFLAATRVEVEDVVVSAE